MKQLIECVDITKAGTTYLLKPKPECELDLVMLGFNGTEKWIRLECILATRGFPMWNYEATIMKANGNAWSWHWGYGGFTLVTDAVKEMGRKIVTACKLYEIMSGGEFPGKGW